jgi:hypothetical protein
MTTPVLVEPIAGGFRATSLQYPALTAEAATEPAAVEAVRADPTARLAAGGRIVHVPPLFDAQFYDAWDWLATDPTADACRAAVEAERRRADAADAERYGAVPP